VTGRKFTPFSFDNFTLSKAECPKGALFYEDKFPNALSLRNLMLHFLPSESLAKSLLAAGLALPFSNTHTRMYQKNREKEEGGKREHKSIPNIYQRQ
jgi:hypothetical protein